WTYRPLVSVVVPVYDPELSWLEDAVKSVQAQVYSEWELCIANDASPSPVIAQSLEKLAQGDPRIKVVSRKKNGGISIASNSALELATGEFVALLDHDDRLRPHALFRIVERLQRDRDLDLIYSDEDKLMLD